MVTGADRRSFMWLYGDSLLDKCEKLDGWMDIYCEISDHISLLKVTAR